MDDYKLKPIVVEERYNVFRAKADEADAPPVMVNYSVSKQEAIEYCKKLNIPDKTFKMDGNKAVYSYWYELIISF